MGKRLLNLVKPIFYFLFFERTEFGYKPVYYQLTITHYVATNNIIHVYFSHMTYLMSHVTFLNNIYEMNGLINCYVVTCNK
jgi:hypothetical protein